MANVSFNSPASSQDVSSQAQVAVMRKAQEQQKQTAVQLIEAVQAVPEPQQAANEPGVGRHLNVTA